MTNKKVVILFGGTSEERRVSVASGQNVAQTLNASLLWFLDPSGKVFECTKAELLSHQNPFERDFVPAAKASYPEFRSALKDPRLSNLIFFLALHGGDGEDGTIQKELESHSIPFTGSGSEASERAFHKQNTKRIAESLGIRTYPDVVVAGEDLSRATREISQMFERHLDIIVKPVSSGSSIGLFRIKDQKRLKECLNELGAKPTVAYLCEPFIQGRELTVGVYNESDRVIALPPSEVRVSPDREFDYDGKYLGVGSLEITPADIPAGASSQAQEMAVIIHKGLGCEGYSRTDMILTETGPVFLETNTLPGLTKASFIPQQLAAAGITFLDFLNNQLFLAEARVTRHRR